MNSKGDRKPDDELGCSLLWVTGDGHQGIGLSGVAVSAIGFGFLRLKAEMSS
jgi:hypothetical protein